MNNCFMLERRILRLEKLLNERSAKPNLFSKNLEDIKLAIESGESIKSTNAAGKSPLAFAVTSSADNAEIVEYLLKKGANPNEVVNKAPLIFLAIKKDKQSTVLALLKAVKQKKTARIDGPRGDISGSMNIIAYACECHTCHNIMDQLISDELMQKFETGEVYWTVNALCEEYVSYGLPENVYVKCIEKAINLATKNGMIVNDAIINKHMPSAELRIKGTHHLLDLLMDNGYWPCWIDDGLSKSKASILYDALVQAIENKMYVEYDLNDVVDVGIQTCTAANQPISIISNLITGDYLASVSPYEVYSAIKDSKYNAELMSNVMKLRSSFNLDDESCNALIEDIINNIVKDGESLKYAYRLLRTYKDYFSPDRDTIESICKKKNQRMFEFLVDLGFVSSFTVPGIKLPTGFKDYFKENGIDFSSKDSGKGGYDHEPYARTRYLIIKNIIDDTWSNQLNNELEEHPEFLEDPAVLDAINNNIENSFTARDLKKRAQRIYSKSQDMYDM